MEQYKIEAALVRSTKKDMFQYHVKLFTAYTTIEKGMYAGRQDKEIHKNVKVIWEGDYWTGTGWFDGKVLFPSGKYDKYKTNLIIQDIVDGKLDPRYKNRLKLPTAKDALACLTLDYGVINHPNFESWADEFGYDKDSREAEKIYNECMKIALLLRSTLGEKEIERLTELLRDY